MYERQCDVLHLWKKSGLRNSTCWNKWANCYEKLGMNFVNFIRNNNTWLLETNKKANIDIGVSSTSLPFNKKFENDNEIVGHITNINLKSLRIKNLNKTAVGHLNVNSIRNKFDFLAHQVKGNIDILMISEGKLDESFPPCQFLLDGYSVPFRFNRNGNGGGILLYIQTWFFSVKRRNSAVFSADLFFLKFFFRVSAAVNMNYYMCCFDISAFWLV